MEGNGKRVLYVKNGNNLTTFYTYSCFFCGKDLPENNPMASVKNGEFCCCDCAFLNGIFSEKDYLKIECGWLCVEKKYAYIENGKIIVGIGKRRTKKKDDRNSQEYTEWRRAVFERDNYTCSKCNSKGGRLNAHHIKPYKEYKELRVEISNGQTLCEKCHRSLHGSH